MRENEIQNQILRAVGSRKDCRLFRNHVGKLQDKFGKWHSFGLMPGSADLVGWKALTIQPEDVGKTIAVFLSIEVKSENGTLRKEQEAWRDAVLRHGGIAIVAKSAQEAEEKI